MLISSSSVPLPRPPQPTTVMPTPPKIATIPWSEKTYTIVSVQCSAALKAPVVLAQKISQSDGKVDTRVYMVDAESSGDWPMIVDLGPAWSDLHQATISGDGRFMMVNMGIGSSEDYPQPVRSICVLCVCVCARARAHACACSMLRICSGSSSVAI